MELKQLLTPWNWFKKEQQQSLPVHHQSGVRSDNPFEQIHHDLDQLFTQFFQGILSSPFRKDPRASWNGFIQPHVDMSEGQKHYTISVEVPGVDQKNIDLTLADGTLMIRGEKRWEHEDHDKQYHRIERSYGSFQRMLSLPKDTDEQTIDAKFRNGVLTITIAKDPEAKPLVQRIAIA